MSAARKKKPTADRGDANRSALYPGRQNCFLSVQWLPMMLEKKPDAARFGLPGRTRIVGNRIPMPSKKPFLV